MTYANRCHRRPRRRPGAPSPPKATCSAPIRHQRAGQAGRTGRHQWRHRRARRQPRHARCGPQWATTHRYWVDLGLAATARDNIFLQNLGDAGAAAVFSGNLLLVAVESLAGDVRIETSGTLSSTTPSGAPTSAPSMSSCAVGFAAQAAALAVLGRRAGGKLRGRGHGTITLLEPAKSPGESGQLRCGLPLRAERRRAPAVRQARLGTAQIDDYRHAHRSTTTACIPACTATRRQRAGLFVPRRSRDLFTDPTVPKRPSCAAACNSRIAIATGPRTRPAPERSPTP